jgi:hypothetical protein
MKRPPIPDPPHAGGCLCGAVRFKLNARPLAVNACHCLDCKKLTGATNLLMILARRDAFVHEGALDRYRKRADSGNEIDIVRCAACGVRLWHEPLSAPQLVIVAVGTLDDTSWAVPTSHIFARSVSPGVVLHEDALVLQDGPRDRQAVFDAFAKVYPPLAGSS